MLISTLWGLLLSLPQFFKEKKEKISSHAQSFQPRKSPTSRESCLVSLLVRDCQAGLREAPPHSQESSNTMLSVLCPLWTWALSWSNLPSPFHRLFQENSKRPMWVQAGQAGTLTPGRGPAAYRCASRPGLSGPCLVNDLQWWTCFQP